jgi:hypothetical protein
MRVLTISDTHIRPAQPTEHAALVMLWELSVRATHDFLTEADIAFYRPLVAEYFQSAALELWVGAAALGAFAATLCHVYREGGGPSCVPDALRFAAIGGAIGLGAGIAIDGARSSSPMVRVTVAF